MRIGIDTYQAGFEHGGIARYVRELVPALADACPKQRFVLFANGLPRRHFFWRCLRPNVRHVDLWLPRRVVQAGWDRLQWPPVETFTGSLNVFHGTHFVLPAVRRAKTVLTVHDLIFLRHPEHFLDQPLNRKEHGARLAATVQRADAIIAVSKRTRDDLIELLKVSADRIRVINEGVAQLFLRPAMAQALQQVRDRLGWQGAYLVFVMGTPEPRKNLPRAVAAARQAAPKLPLVIVGPPDPIKTLLKGDTRGTILIGSLPDAELAALLQGATLALYPSLAEGFGLPALEALAAGVPLVTSNVGALPEVVGDAALSVDPHSTEAIAEAIRCLLADDSLRQDMIEAGRARAGELSWERAASKTMALYRELA